jgi:hypothetical protein
MTTNFALRLRLHNEEVRQNENRNKLVRKIKQTTYPYMGIRGFAPGFPEPLDDFCDGPSTEPLVGPRLLGAVADEAAGVFFAIEAVWPRVLMPDDGALVSGIGVADLPANEVRGDRVRGRGTTDVNSRTTGSVDPLSECPSRALLFACSSSASMDAKATLDA